MRYEVQDGILIKGQIMNKGTAVNHRGRGRLCQVFFDKIEILNHCMTQRALCLLLNDRLKKSFQCPELRVPC